MRKSVVLIVLLGAMTGCNPSDSISTVVAPDPFAHPLEVVPGVPLEVAAADGEHSADESDALVRLHVDGFALGSAFLEDAPLKDKGYAVVSQRGKDLYVDASLINLRPSPVQVRTDSDAITIRGYHLQIRIDGVWTEVPIEWCGFLSVVSRLTSGQRFRVRCAVPRTSDPFRFGIGIWEKDCEEAIIWTNALQVKQG
jgi:hypothetical protein